jgi:hypothetical protein
MSHRACHRIFIVFEVLASSFYQGQAGYLPCELFSSCDLLLQIIHKYKLFRPRALGFACARMYVARSGHPGGGQPFVQGQKVGDSGVKNVKADLHRVPCRHLLFGSRCRPHQVGTLTKSCAHDSFSCATPGKRGGRRRVFSGGFNDIPASAAGFRALMARGSAAWHRCT